MSGGTTVIEIEINAKDNTKAGVSSSISSISKIEKAMVKAQKEIEKLQKMRKIELAVYALDKASKIFNSVWNLGKKLSGKAWKVTLKAVDLVTVPFKGIIKTLSNPIVAAAGIAGVSIGIADVVNTYKDFEQGMANVRAITGATDENMTALTETAKTLGEQTMFSAKQVAGGMEFLAMAGWKTKDVISGMPGLLNLAAAGGVEVATAADVVSSALAQFKMEASEASKVADILAATATNSKTDIIGLGESLKYTGSIAGGLGYDLKDVALGLGLMGEIGLDSSMAGTAMRSLILRMSKQDLDEADKAGVVKAMKALGVSIYDEKGETKPLLTVFEEIRKGFKKIKNEDKSSIANSLAGTYGATGLLAIAEASEDKFKKIKEAIENSKGAAEEMSKIRMKTLEGSMFYLQSAADGVKLAFMERLAPYLKDFIDWLTSKMPDLKEAAVDFADSIAQSIENTTKVIEDMLKSPEWQNAETFWDKIKVAWDKLIAEPFESWWNSSGKSWIANKAKGIGEGIGKAITFGFTSLFGGDTSSIVEDGISIGSAFGEGFAKGFDGEKVAGAIKNALQTVVKTVFSNPITGTMATAWIGSKIFGLASSIPALLKSGKNLWLSLFGSGMAGMGTTASAGLFSGVAQGLAIRKAAKITETARVAKAAKMGSIAGRIGNTPAESALILAQNGKMGIGAKIGAAGLGRMTIGAGAAAGGLYAGSTLFGAIGDFYEAVNSNDKKKSTTYTKSGLAKATGVGAGAAIGAAIGTFIPIPVIGTGTGALIGAGIGAIFGNSVGNSQIEKYEKELQNEEEKKFAELLRKKQSKYSSEKLKQALAKGISEDSNEFMQIFQKEVVSGLEKKFGSIKLSLSEIQNIAKKITFGNATKSFEVFEQATATAEANLSELQNSALNLKKINWKANLSRKTKLQWTDDDQSEFVDETKNMISKSMEFIENKHFEATAAVKLLYNIEGEADKNSVAGKMIEGIDSVYTYIQEQINEKSKQIEITLNDPNIKPIDKQEIVSKYLEEIDGINADISEAKQNAKLNYLNVKYGGEGMSFNSFAGLQEELGKYVQEAEQEYRKAFEESSSIIDLKVKYKIDEMTYEKGEQEKAKLAAKLQEDLANLTETSLSFQIPAIAKIFEKAGLADKILPNFEGTLQERLQKAISDALSINPDSFKGWTNEQWIQFLRLSKEDSALLAGEVGTLLDPVVQSISDGYLKKFKEETLNMTDEAYRFIKNDLDTKFGQEMQVDIKVKPNIIIEKANAKLAGEEISFNYSDVEFSPSYLQKEAEKLTPTTISSKNSGAGWLNSAKEVSKIVTPHAEGGILNKPHMGIVAEDGAEAIIPLTEKRRGKGIRLWERAGEILGMIPKHAEGGIFGNIGSKLELNNQNTDSSESNTVLSPPISVDLGGINITINTSSKTEDSGDIMEIIRENMPEITNDIADTIAKALLKLFPNMKAGTI